MGLAIRKDSKWWYGRYTVDGREFVRNLKVEIKGVPPDKLSMEGDRLFENSRIRAEEKFNTMMAALDSGKSEEQLAEAVYQARAGSKLKKYLLADMPQIWIDKPRNRVPSYQHRAQSIAKLNKFSEFISERYPKLTRVDQLRAEHIKAFLDDLELSGLSGETWNKYLVVIKGVLKRVGVPAAIDFIGKDTDTVFREPYSIEELHAVLEASKFDPLIHKLAVVAATTAMRRKDCCFLRWDSVDFDEGFITVKTSKTGVTVDIPTADLLNDVLKSERGNGSEYVFPDAVELYESNPTAITHRFKNILRRAGFDDGKEKAVEFKVDQYTTEELHIKASELYAGKKLDRAIVVIDAYASGLSMKESAGLAGVGQSSGSVYLNDLEKATGKNIIRGKMRTIDGLGEPTRGSIRKERKSGKLAASVRDFHSFRTTWVTLALMNGMPIDTVRLVTGHKTADIVTKHYFKPHRAELKKAMRKTLPELLTSGVKEASPAERASEVLRGTGGLQKRIDAALKILDEG
jgi:integrase